MNWRQMFTLGVGWCVVGLVAGIVGMLLVRHHVEGSGGGLLGSGVGVLLSGLVLMVLARSRKRHE